jgi:hypothetical protein
MQQESGLRLHPRLLLSKLTSVGKATRAVTSNHLGSHSKTLAKTTMACVWLLVAMLLLVETINTRK